MRARTDDSIVVGQDKHRHLNMEGEGALQAVLAVRLSKTAIWGFDEKHAQDVIINAIAKAFGNR